MSDKKDKLLFKTFYGRIAALGIYLAMLIFGCWLSFKIWSWIIYKLISWSHTLGLIATIISLIWCIVGIFFYQFYSKIHLEL